MMLALYTVLNQLVMKLDRRLQMSAHVTNGYQAVVRVDGPPLEDCLPRTFVRWAIKEDISEPQLVLRECTSPHAAQESNDSHRSEPDSDSDLDEALQDVM